MNRWEAAKKQSRKKWTDGRQLRNKEERSGHIVAAEKTKQKEVLHRKQLRNKAEKGSEMADS